MDKSEILVHISAPSGAGDDARYRAQVEAILNFQAHSREPKPLSAGEHNETRSSTSPDSCHLQPGPTDSETIDPPPAVPPGPSPSHRNPKRHASRTDSLETPVSCIPDSQPPVHPSLAAESLSLLPEITHGSLALSKRPRVGYPSSNSPQNEEVQRDVAKDLTTKDNNASLLNNGPSIPSSSAEGEPSTQQQPIEAEAQPQHSILLSFPQEIKPPPPPFSQAPFTTHITPTLEMLTKRLNPPRTYKPTAQTRDLDPLERGYWFVRLTIDSPSLETDPEAVIKTSSPQSWDRTSFTKFWTFLSDFISKEGRAGWGVWCILEEEENEDKISLQAAQAQEAHRDPDVLTGSLSLTLTLKVYAWGEIATHIYLLLFLASNRRIRKMGAQWRDSRDEVVIQMP
ncbi:hypothetical protein BDV06DRAFT_191387 [Aspergillus oleicola]